MSRISELAVVNTPIGEIRVLYGNHPFRIHRVILPGEAFSTMEPPPAAQTPSQQVPYPLGGMLMDALTGRAAAPPWDLLCTQGLTPLQMAVYRETAAIPHGSVRTYKDIAIRIGHPFAFRAVGSALAKNPFPILIPCHRVIRSDKTLGGFGGGADLKKHLIQFERQTAGSGLQASMNP